MGAIPASCACSTHVDTLLNEISWPEISERGVAKDDPKITT